MFLGPKAAQNRFLCFRSAQDGVGRRRRNGEPAVSAQVLPSLLHHIPWLLFRQDRPVCHIFRLPSSTLRMCFSTPMPDDSFDDRHGKKTKQNPVIRNTSRPTTEKSESRDVHVAARAARASPTMVAPASLLVYKLCSIQFGSRNCY
ncbi:hypothetical protein OPV22_022335 [Ensete ventricosum]|uniref:Uncharacterized protein n=1 Tax=Ensete ventricosum TaxID=4639 RepID=A0AAV8QN96_ENSVE|nr:hypothetical protein OPV22_022335 [Ensete ventricosum]